MNTKSDILELPANERAELAEVLLASLDPAEDATLVEAAWKSEALARYERVLSGASTVQEAGAVFEEARKLDP